VISGSEGVRNSACCRRHRDQEASRKTD
jgi:hypothetical protein